MPYFFYRLTPPSPSFAYNMTPSELTLMQTHVGYWTDLAARGIAIIFGPVGDPAGVWGLGIVEVADEADARAISANDPVMQSGLAFRYEIYPMVRAMMRG